AVLEFIRRAHDGRSGGLQLRELAPDVGGLDVPDQPARRDILASDLGMRPDRHVCIADLPTGIAALFEAGLAEQPAVVLHEARRIGRSDQDSVELHLETSYWSRNASVAAASNGEAPIEEWVTPGRIASASPPLGRPSPIQPPSRLPPSSR